MIFPFSVRYDKLLKTIVTSDNKERIFQYIQKSILEDKADHVVVKETTVEYNGSTSIWRGSLFGSVDNGVFYLVCKNDLWFLIYQINMLKLFIGTVVLSSIMGVFAIVTGGPWWVSIAVFFWLCGANWIIILIRHESVAASMAIGIDKLFRGRTELHEQDKMNGKVKSWL